MPHPSFNNIIIMGGSLGGLTAALALRDIGCDVMVYERTRTPLAGQGAGIVLNPATVRYLVERRNLDIATISVSAQALHYLDAVGGIAHERAVAYRFSSYNALYRGLLDAFDPARYRLNTAIEHFAQDDRGVMVRLSGGAEQRCDLLVCADGVRSTARKILSPEAQASYVGYVAWRGTVSPADLSPRVRALFLDTITYRLMPNSHLLTYPIPVADSVASGDSSRLNWLWYRNIAEGPALDAVLTDRSGQRRDVSVPAGMVADSQLDQLRTDTVELLPPPLVELVQATAQPFVQAIVDLEVPRMAFGRVCLIGDAAFVARPHAAAGTAKAAADAWALAETLLAKSGDISAALPQWEQRQLAVGRGVLQRTREAGRRVQFDGTWHVGDELPFGLYQIGDSVMR